MDLSHISEWLKTPIDQETKHYFTITGRKGPWQVWRPTSKQGNHATSPGWKPLRMKAAQPCWATCSTVWLSLWEKNLSLYPISSFTYCFLPAHTPCRRAQLCFLDILLAAMDKLPLGPTEAFSWQNRCSSITGQVFLAQIGMVALQRTCSRLSVGFFVFGGTKTVCSILNAV